MIWATSTWRLGCSNQHEGNQVREFYSGLPRPALVGIEATGSMQWFLRLLEELEIDYRIGHPAKIRAAEPRKQKNDPERVAMLCHKPDSE